MESRFIKTYMFLFQFAICHSFMFEKHILTENNVEIIDAKTVSFDSVSAIQCAYLAFKHNGCQASYDETSMVCRYMSSVCCSENTVPSYGKNLMNVLQSPGEKLTVCNGLDIGYWAGEDYCQAGHYAIGYGVGVEDNNSDNTGVNTIWIICGSVSETGVVSGNRTSREAEWTTYERSIMCPENTALVSFALQMDEYENKTGIDDTGATWIKFKCRSFYDYSSFGELEASNADLNFLSGTYGLWSKQCRLGSGICGIQTRIQDWQGNSNDDLALTDVQFICC